MWGVGGTLEGSMLDTAHAARSGQIAEPEATDFDFVTKNPTRIMYYNRTLL